MPAEAIVFTDEKVDNIRQTCSRMEAAPLVEMLLNVFTHAHVLAEHAQYPGLHNTLTCGEAAFTAIAERWIPEDVVLEAVERFNTPLDDA